MSHRRDAVIVGAVRSAIGKRNGGLSGVSAIDLSAHVLNALAARTSIDPASVDDVIWGCVQQVGEQSVNVGRNAVLSAGWPETVPATTIDRQCGSSQQSVHFAAAGLVAGHYELAIAGGVEMLSRLPIGANVVPEYGQPFTESLRERYGVDEFNQGIGAELMADHWKLSRTRLDEFSLASHEKAAAAIDEGRFSGRDRAVRLPGRHSIRHRRGRPARHHDREDGHPQACVQAGRRHPCGQLIQISDGAAALLLTTSENAAGSGLIPSRG